MPPSKEKKTQKQNKACRRSARLSQKLPHGPSAKESCGGLKRKVSIQEERAKSGKFPRLEADEDGLTAREKACSDGKTATSESKTDNTAASREGIMDSDEREMAVEQLGRMTRMSLCFNGNKIGLAPGVPDMSAVIFLELACSAAYFARSYGIDMEGFNKLPKKDRQEALESAKGYVIQGDVDEVAARFEGTWDQLCHCVLGGFLSKYILQKFWGDDSLFWWLEPDLQVKDDKTVPPQFGTRPNSLYKGGSKGIYCPVSGNYCTGLNCVERPSTVPESQKGEGDTFGKHMKEHRRSLIHSIIVPELLASKTMGLLLKDAKSQAALKELQVILEKYAEDAALMSSYPFRVRFEELDDLPTDYLDLPAGARADYKGVFHQGNDSPLHGKKVLAITQPASYGLGTMGSHKEEQLISPGRFIINWNWRDGRNLEW